MGWKAVEAAFRERLGTKVHKDGEERTIPAVTEGQTFHPVTASISEHYTTPPKPYSEDTLLSAMETAGNQEFDEETEKKGLGTPATRASIIEKLVSSGYAVRKGKQLCGVSYAGGGRWQGCFPSGVPEEEKIKTFPQRLREGQV